jgi:hypothetical protein
MDEYDDDFGQEWDEDQEWDEEFEDPSGYSALRRATSDNPRNCPCPTCGEENVLTPKDVRLGYQCNRCADIAEGRAWPRG